MAFSYYSPLTVTSNSALLPSTQTNFPLLVSITDARLKTVSNGGHVQNSSGFDIRPYSDSGLTSAMTYELEFYDGTNGILVMWVLVASLSLGLTFYLAYGNSALVTDGSSASTWDTNFKAVYHLKDGTTLNVNSATGSNNGTNHGATATTGQIDGGAALDRATKQYISANDDASIDFGTTPCTISCWFKKASNGWSGGMASKLDASDVAGWTLTINSSNFPEGFFGVSGAFYDVVTSGSAITDTNWHHAVMTRNGTNVLLYVDGSQVASVADSALNINNAEIFAIGPYRSGDLTQQFFDGSIDEVRLSNANRGPDWITAEYNNGSAPATFVAIGTEVAAFTYKRSHFLIFFPQTTK